MTLLELLRLMRKHLKMVIALPVVFAIVTFAFAFAFLPNTYTASTNLYILTSSDESTLSNSDLAASQMITNDVVTLVKSERVLKDVKVALQMDNLSGYSIGVDSSTTTRVIELSVTGSDAQSTAIIANALAEDVSKVAQEVMEVKSVNVIDEAQTPVSPSGPNRLLYTAIAFLAGLFVAVAIAVLADMLNTRARDAEDVEKMLGVPVIGRIPAMKGGK